MSIVLTGDTHGRVAERIENLRLKPHDNLIILGDAGLNFYLSGTDDKAKNKVTATEVIVYCIRGNHDCRPEDLDYGLFYDSNVHGDVYIQSQYQNIRYFKDGGTYTINGQSVLVIGGAYSIDKEYRLSRASANKTTWTGWFANEQLSEEERNTIQQNVAGKHFDIVLTHTCPIEWRPQDSLMINVTEDPTMELWLQDLQSQFTWDHWFCGHFHQNMRLRRNVILLYNYGVAFPDFDRNLTDLYDLPKDRLYYAD